MRNVNYSVLRSLLALVLGVVLLAWPNAALNYLIITIGVLFILPGVFSIISYFVNRGQSENSSSLPIEGVGSLLFGLCLLIAPGFFADILTVLLGVLLILGGGQQLASLVRARKWTNIPFLFYIVPMLILVAGIMVVVNPEGIRATVLMIIGVTALFYGLFELINWYKFTRHNPKRAKSVKIDDAVYIDEE